MKRRLGFVGFGVIATLLLAGCTSAETEATVTGSGSVVIPNPPENSDHGYLLEDDRIPSITTCEEWEEFWVYEGPAVSFAVAEPAENDELAVSTQIYLKNSVLDKNKDGIICYLEDVNNTDTPTVAISSETSLSPATECQIKSTNTNFNLISSGFPRNPDYSLPEDRKIVIQLIFVDAEDLRHTELPSKDADFWIEGAGQFLTDVTDGKIDFEWRFENQYFGLPKPFSSYGITRSKQGNPVDYVQAAITAADDKINFTDVDIVIAVAPPTISSDLIDYSPALPLSKGNGFKTNEGSVYRGTLAGSDTRWQEGYLLIAHEIGHLLGLEDYYSFEWKMEDPYEDQFKFMGEFDNMNSAAGKAREWTGWSRWLIGALDDSQVRCVTDDSDSTHQLWAISNSVAKPKIAVIPTSDTSAIVIETRKTLRNDRMLPRDNQGLLVYVVDTTKPNGLGPLQIVRKPNLMDPFLLDAALGVGESVTVDGYKIENIETAISWDVAKITRQN